MLIHSVSTDPWDCSKYVPSGNYITTNLVTHTLNLHSQCLVAWETL